MKSLSEKAEDLLESLYDVADRPSEGLHVMLVAAITTLLSSVDDYRRQRNDVEAELQRFHPYD